MSDAKSLTKITNKYHCMASGEKLMNPCKGCTNSNGCLSRGMQYKENEDPMDEKALLKISADGTVLSCAKGLPSGQCGYKAGAEVCGACGAKAVIGKGGMMAMADDDEMDEEYVMPKKKKGGMMGMPAKPMMAVMEDEEDDEEMPPMKKRTPMMAPMEDEEDDEDEDMPMAAQAPAPAPAPRAMPSPRPMMAPMEEADDEEEDEDVDEMMADRRKMRSRRLAHMGYKAADFDENAFVCAFERKVYPGQSGVCENCPGGCAPEGKLPGLLDIEGLAEDMFSAKVLDSGYSDKADLYVVDLERKDGKVVEAFFEGSTAECLGWHLLDNDLISQKSLEDNAGSIVNFSEAADIAVKTIQGSVIGVDPDVFEGYDAYAVEIDGVDGKSYDVYVSLDGEVLGYDEYSAEEAEEIEAEAAEIALKRAYSEETRKDMAKSGHAMPDGSFPIKDEEDLRNAIQAYGRAKDKKAAKAHIIKRAMKLGKENLIPMNWVPRKIQEEFEGKRKAASDDFVQDLQEFLDLELTIDSTDVEEKSASGNDELLAQLMEFEVLAAEEDAKRLAGDS